MTPVHFLNLASVAPIRANKKKPRRRYQSIASLAPLCPSSFYFFPFHQNRIMAKSQNQLEHMGVTVWVEKSSKKKRYEIASIRKSGNTTRAGFDIFPGFCGSSKAWTLTLFCSRFLSDFRPRAAQVNSSSVGNSLQNGQTSKGHSWRRSLSNRRSMQRAIGSKKERFMFLSKAPRRANNIQAPRTPHFFRKEFLFMSIE